MTSGTAQKMALNLLSTQIMIELGRVHDGWMVDLVPTNAKLVRRAKSILQSIAAVGEEEAERLWGQSGGDLKIAVLMAQGATAREAGELLERCGGRLALGRQALNRSDG